MTISIRPAAASSVAAKLVEDVLYKRDIYHIFFGKIEPWEGVDVPSSAPPVSEQEDRRIRANMSFLTRVMPGDVSPMCSRTNWQSGVVYDEWDDSVDMSTKTFFVTNESFGVYKCLDNANGVPSTVPPSGTPFAPFRTSDGYLWKYMFTVPASKQKRFVSGTFIPVQRAFTDSFYNNGAIEKVLIESAGSGYTMLPITSLVVSGTTTGTGAVMSVGTVDGNGAILTVTVTNGGSGYTSTNLTIAGGGTGAILTPVISGGVITSVTVTNGGSGYSAAAAVSATVGGAVLTPVIVDGSIESVTIVSSGAGYTGTPTISINTLPGYSVGAGKYPGNSSAIITPLMLDGRIDRIMIEDPGTTYDADDATTIVVVGDGTGAVLRPVVEAGKIVDVFVESPGEGYTSATLNVVGVGTGAVLSAVISDYDLSTDQSIVEQSAIDGGIHLIKVVSGGAGYTATTQVNITGDGEGAVAVATVSSGVVQKITVTSWGSGYSWANVTITDSNRYDPAELLPIATARVVISPKGGHGSNAPVELGANVAAFSLIVRDIPEINLIDQEFRQYGLIRNLRDYETLGRVDALEIYTPMITTFVSTTGLVPDMVLDNEYASFRVVFVSGQTVHLVALSKNSSAPIGQLTDSQSNAWTCRSVTSSSTVDKYSGDIYFVSNEPPFVVDEQQGVNIKTFISF